MLIWEMNRDLEIGYNNINLLKPLVFPGCIIFAESAIVVPFLYSPTYRYLFNSQIRGPLYAKFRRRQTFNNFMAVLTSRTLIIYEHTARSIRGIAQPRIHYKKLRSIDLRHCYVYSGTMVDSELMYQTTTLDPHLGYRVLPKVYWDRWTSVDDDLSYFSLQKSDPN